MRTPLKLLLASCLLPVSCLVLAVETLPPLSLSGADALLLEANPAILQARAALAGARAGIDMAGARPNPTLSASVTSINPARNSAGGYWDRPMDSVLRVDQTLERGDKRELRLRAADRNLAATGADLDNTIRLARMALANAWLNLRAAQEIRQIAAENARLAARAAEAAEIRGKAHRQRGAGGAGSTRCISSPGISCRKRDGSVAWYSPKVRRLAALVRIRRSRARVMHT